MTSWYRARGCPEERGGGGEFMVWLQSYKTWMMTWRMMLPKD